MSGPNEATPGSYFDDLWAASDDPWAHGERWYETRKYDLTMAALPRQRYRSVFEPGCAAGFLTERLAARAEHVLAMERSPRGTEVTAARCAPFAHVEVRTGRIPDDWPTEAAFDLVVLSEVLYYLADDELTAVLDRVAREVARGSDVIAVHYRPGVPEHVRRGDGVHARIRDRFDVSARYEDPTFLVDVLAARASDLVP